MLLQPVDWIIIVVYLVGCVAAGVWMKRYVRVVDDFAVAGREMDINLGVASLAATEMGIVTIMYTAQMGFKHGFAGATPGVVIALAMFVVGATGFVIGPLREAGVITIPELFEKRFGKRVRWLAGLVVVLGGVLNMGIFLRLGGEFLVHVTGLPPAFLEWTMTGLLGVVLLYTVLGGMLSVLVTDYLQFLVMGLGIVITSVLVVTSASLGWSKLVSEMPEAHQISYTAEQATEAAKEVLDAAGVREEEPAEAEEASEQPPPDEEAMKTPAKKLVGDAARASSAAGEDAKTAAEAAKAARAAATRVLLESYDVQASGQEASKGLRQANQAAEQVAELAREAETAAEKAEKAAEQAEKSAAVARSTAQQDEATQAAASAVAERAAGRARDATEDAVAARERALEAERIAVAKTAVAKEKVDTARQDAARVAQAVAGELKDLAEQKDLAPDRARLAAEKAKLAAENVHDATGNLSMGNPFNPTAPGGLGWGWVIWQSILAVAVVTTWQTNIARVLSAKDAKTARKVYRRTAFYFVGRFGLPGLWGAAAFVYFWSLGGLPEGLTDLTAMPAYLNTLLPTGILGIMIAAMLAAEMSTDSGYLLTWATVIYNDLVMPCLRRPLSEKARLLTVRSLVVVIGIFLVVYGLWYELPGAAWDYLAVTGNIYLASVFALLVGALYWRGSNSWGAIAALVLGAVGPITFLIVNAIVPEESPYRIAPEVAGLSAFALAFGGMFFGSLLGQAFGRGASGEPADDSQEETP